VRHRPDAYRGPCAAANGRFGDNLPAPNARYATVVRRGTASIRAPVSMTRRPVGLVLCLVNHSSSLSRADEGKETQVGVG